MTKKHFEAAALIVQDMALNYEGADGKLAATAAAVAFADLFMQFNPNFDAARFHAACVPGANVRAKGSK